MHDPQALMERIQALPPERIAEVENFVEFIAAREREPHSAALPRSSARPPLLRSGTTRPTKSTMPFEFGDVVLVPFPFTSQAAAKQRPAVVVVNAV